MDSLIFVILICITVPLILTLRLLEKPARLIIGFLVLGMLLCVFASQINGLIREYSSYSLFYITTNYTPVVEEICKALPILFFAFCFSDDKDKLISLALSVGIGFAVVENVYIFAQNNNSLSILWAFERVFGASLMHGLSTAMVGYGISFAHKRRKLFYTGTFSLLLLAIVFHSVYNSLVQSSLPELGLVLTIICYIPAVIGRIINGRKNVKKHC